MPPEVPPSPFDAVPGELEPPPPDPPPPERIEMTPFLLCFSRVYEPLPLSCGNRSARVTPSCERLSASRMVASRTSRLDFATRPSKADSSGSWKLSHQCGSGGSATGVLAMSRAAVIGGRSPNHAAGDHHGAGRWKSGPRVQPATAHSAAPAATRRRWSGWGNGASEERAGAAGADHSPTRCGAPTHEAVSGFRRVAMVATRGCCAVVLAVALRCCDADHRGTRLGVAQTQPCMAPGGVEVQSIEAVLDAVDEAGAQARWMDFLRIPSVSAQPAHAADCRAAAQFARDDLASLGFAARLVETAGHPVVLAHHPGPPGSAGPRLLYYGHYDVQPAEPLELWHSPPFEPQVVDGPHGPRVVARGAVDDKGQVAMWLAAFRAWHAAAGTMPLPITVLIEGEEEVGSANLEIFLREHAGELAADAVVVSDTDMWNVATPAICTSLRGLVYMQVDVRAASRDLHSGMFGGSALNPITALTRILGALHDAEGRVVLDGFYDGVAEVTPEQAAQWATLGFDEAAFLGGIGLSVPAGERDRGGLERLWARPTAEVNGIWGGYSGIGSKTVIPAEAGAKVSFRLVPGQDPAQVAAAFEAFVRARLPADAGVSFQTFGHAPGVRVALDTPLIQAARAALADEYGRPAVLVGGGGSIPVVEAFRRLLGLDTLLMGFGLNDDQIHSPNEKFEVVCFRHGVRSHVRLLGRLAAT